MKTHRNFIYLFVIILFLSCAKNQTNGVIANTATVLYYGADSSGNKDSSVAFRKALLSNHAMLVVPKGKYIINETIELKKHLRLMPGVVIKKTKQGNDGPIFWLSKSFAKLEGLNRKTEIKSEKNVPNGIIRIGHESSKVKGENILFAEVENLRIIGPGYSKSTKNIGIHLFSAQSRDDQSTTSYFHTIDNVILQNLDSGIFLEGMTNANSISNIILNRVGFGTADVAIYLKGAMENRISDVFHHYSQNSTTILLDNFIDMNNDTIVPSYNYLSQIISEQGGEKALCINVRSGFSNSIGVLCNTEGGNVMFKDFDRFKNIMHNN